MYVIEQYICILDLHCSEVLNYIYMYIHLCHGNHIKRIEMERKNKQQQMNFNIKFYVNNLHVDISADLLSEIGRACLFVIITIHYPFLY